MILVKSYKEKYVLKYVDFWGFRDVFASKLRVVANFEHPDLNAGKSFSSSLKSFWISITQTLKYVQTSNIQSFAPPPIAAP